MSWACLAAETTSAWWWGFLSHPLAIAILAGVISASITARWALRRHRTTQLWDEKFRTYCRLFEGLHGADQWHSEEAQKYGVGSEPPDMLAWLEASASALKEVRKSYTLSPFLLSREARQALGDFLVAHVDREMKIGEYCQSEWGWYTYPSEVAASMSRFVESFAPIARRDLEKEAGVDASCLFGWLRRKNKDHNAEGKD